MCTCKLNPRRHVFPPPPPPPDGKPTGECLGVLCCATAACAGVLRCSGVAHVVCGRVAGCSIVRVYTSCTHATDWCGARVRARPCTVNTHTRPMRQAHPRRTVACAGNCRRCAPHVDCPREHRAGALHLVCEIGSLVLTHHLGTAWRERLAHSTDGAGIAHASCAAVAFAPEVVRGGGSIGLSALTVPRGGSGVLASGGAKACGGGGGGVGSAPPWAGAGGARVMCTPLWPGPIAKAHGEHRASTAAATRRQDALDPARRTAIIGRWARAANRRSLISRLARRKPTVLLGASFAAAGWAKRAWASLQRRTVRATPLPSTTYVGKRPLQNEA